MASIKDVAQRAGVSMSTASIIINGKGNEKKISAETQERVRRAIKELQYVPNRYARSLRQSHSSKYEIALFLSFDYRRVMMSRFISSLQEKIMDNEELAGMTIYPYESGSLCRQSKHFASGNFDAAIIANAAGDDLEFLAAEKYPCRIVLYNRFHSEFSSVNIDDRKIGSIAAGHLLDAGYTRPQIILGRRNFPGAVQREDSFCDVFEAQGISIDRNAFLDAENSLDGGAECAGLLLEKYAACPEKLPDSFFCASDMIALGFVNELTRKGVRIPEDLGVIAIGNGEKQYSQHNNPSITVVDIPMEAMAEKAADILLSQAGCEDFKIERFDFETRLIKSETTARNKPDLILTEVKNENEKSNLDTSLHMPDCFSGSSGGMR